MSVPERLAAASRHDVVVVGDGPAGSALSCALAAADVDVLLVGDDAPWTATYGTWVDELPSDPSEPWHLTDRTTPGASASAVAGVGSPHLIRDRVLASRSGIDVHGHRRHELVREYGVFDNEHLRAALRRAPHRIGRVRDLQHVADGVRLVTDDRDVYLGRLVIDATGASAALVAQSGGEREHGGGGWQCAYGLVLGERPAALDGDRAVLMDWRSPGTPFHDEATFLYAVPLDSGRWLVEETSLVRRDPMDATELRLRLAARLGRDLTPDALHVEHVAIPMRGGVPSRRSRVVGFGAAARYLHPATGYSVTASIRAAPRVAAGVAAALTSRSSPDELAARAWAAVWPAAARRTRGLHDRGLAALLRMRPDDVRTFFDAFFSLPEPSWAEYLRIDASPLAVSRTMAAVFSEVPWSLRRRLATGNPWTVARSLMSHVAAPRPSGRTGGSPAPSRRARTR